MKIGNIVKIKKNICDMSFYNSYMEPYCGKVATIVQYIDGGFIKLDIDNEEWWWTEEMIELIEDANAKDTLGSKMRNHLSPFYNALCAISHCKQNVKECNITKDMLLEYLFNSYEDMLDSYKELLNISYNSILDETETND
jgi:dipeptidase